jgi:peptidoglycan/xylan/chitin deacetylase (PgdA/CDA1 family)
MTRVPVLCYHAVSDAPSAWIADVSVTPDQFASHLATITALGRTPVGPGVLADALADRVPLPTGAVVITFDDGFADTATVAAPLLADAGFPAGIYVTTGVVGGHSPGGDQMLTWRQISELAAAGFEIGGHTHRHHQLDAVSAAVARADVVECRDRLQDRLGHPVAGFAYPHGYSSPAVRRIVHDAGFTHAYAVRNAVSTETDDRYAISRLTVTADTDSVRLAAWLADQHLPPRPWPRPLLVAGWRAYRRAAALHGGPHPWVATPPDTPADAARPTRTH